MAFQSSSFGVDPVEDTFPVCSLLPKKETGAASFIERNPNFDGRGVKIAILDSGIDPGAPGLSVTTDGKPKIIHLCDASGAGDVDTSVKVLLDSSNSTIIGLTGRTLKIPKTWPKALNGEYHIGLKSGYELYPKFLKNRVRNAFTEQKVNPQLNLLRAHVLSQTQVFKESQEKLNGQERSNEDKLLVDEYQARQNLVELIPKIVTDKGPAYDVICYNNGTSWKVCIDTSETGDLFSCQLLSPFSEAQEFGTLTQTDRINYGVNVHNNGNLVEIVSMSSAHGTHVASIAAANFPNEPEKNGLAPGAQLIGIGIGDSRLGSEETGTALVRAFTLAVELGADVINMSYGEQSRGSKGRIMEVLEKVICKYGIIFVVSAGNDGPALSTVNSPPSCVHDAISVGAWIAPNLMSAGYSMRQKLPATYYTWTSRGPNFDGALNVTICAPGGAITSVPNWTLKHNQLMNGTSMAAPNATGCVALLLSGLKQKKIPYSPFSVKRSIQNTASKPSNYDVFAMGSGVISVEKAFEHLETHCETLDRDVRFQIKINSMSLSEMQNNAGIYLREPIQTKLATIHNISIEPSYLNDMDSSSMSVKCSDTQRNIDFNMNFLLTCDASYVSIPSYLSLSYMTRTFSVKIDPTALSPGLHYTSIRAYDAANQAKGVMFEVPITIIKTLQVTDKLDWKLDFPEMTFRPDMDIPRFFIEVPHGTTCAEFEISHRDNSDPATIMFHSVQLVPQTEKRKEYRHHFILQNTHTLRRCFPLVSNQTLECTFGKFWSSFESSNIKASIKFFGLSPLNYLDGTLTLNHGEQLSRIDIISPFRRDAIQPSISLKHLATPLKPSSSKISPLSTRSNMTFGIDPIYELILTYAINIAAKTNEVTFDCRLLSNSLYDCEYESQLWMLFDSNKSLIASGDYSPSRYHVDLDKGDYTLRFQVRHPTLLMVKKLEDMQILMISKLNSANGINLDIFASHSDGVNGKKFKESTLNSGTIKPLYVSSLTTERLPKGVSFIAGSHLKGSLVLAKCANRQPYENFPIVYNIDIPPSKPTQPVVHTNKKHNHQAIIKPDSTTTESLTKSGDDEETKSYQEELLEFKLNWLAKLEGTCADQVFKELESIREEHQATRSLNYLKSMVNTNLSEMTLDSLNKIEAHCSEILAKVKPMNILNQLTIANRSASSGEKCPKAKELEKLKNLVVETLIKKAVAICGYICQHSPYLFVKPDLVYSLKTMNQATQGDDKSTVCSDTQLWQSENIELPETVKEQLHKLDDLYFELFNFGIELNDPKVVKFVETHAALKGHYARAIVTLMSPKDLKTDAEFYKSLMRYFRLMEQPWNWIGDNIDRSFHVRCPESYRLF